MLGMHRSGTSAVTGVLQKLGVELGEELLPPSRDNPKGYFENARVVAVHETLFAAFQQGWQDPRPLPAQWRETSAGDQAHEALAALVGDMFDRSRIVAVKDPRTSRVVPLWEDVARATRAGVGAVLVVRHPGEVAASLRKRDGLSRTRAHLLWMTYLLEAERASRVIPRAFVSYEALLADWRSTLARMRVHGLGDMVPEPHAAAGEEIDAFLDVSLRSHGAAGSAEGASPIEALANELYGLSLKCAAGPVEDAEARFDHIARRLAPMAAQYFEAPLQLEQAIERQRLEQARIDASLQLAALRELWRPALPSRPPGAARLYYRTEAGDFVETEALSAEPEVSGSRRRVIFEMPPEAHFDYLRVDPDSAPGVYAIESLSIGGERVTDLAERLRGLNELAMPATRPGDALRLAALGEDPHFVVETRGLTRAGGSGTLLQIEVCFRSETVLSEVGDYLEDYRVTLQTHGRDLEEWQSGIGASVRALDEHRERIEDSIRLLPDLASRQRVIESTLQGIGSRQEQVEAHVQALPGLSDHQQQLGRAIDALRRQGEDMHAALRQQVEVLDTLRQRSEADVDERWQGVVRHQQQLEHAVDALRVHGDSSMRALIDRLETTLHSQEQRLAAAIAGEMHEVRHQHSLLLTWAQRRSPRYWLQRLRSPASGREAAAESDRLPLAPLANLQRAPGKDEDGAWLSVNDDPQFLIGGDALDLGAGWYLFQADFGHVEGSLTAPCLYPDYGAGVTESGRIALPQADANGRIEAVVLLAHATARLRFDPSTTDACFAISHVTMRPLGRAGALSAMVRLANRAAEGGGAGSAVLRAFARQALVGRVSAGGDAAFAAYQQATRPVIDEYVAWVRSYDTLTDADIESMRHAAEGLEYQPLVSVLLPVYETSPHWLERCLDSVVAQAYPNWELCVVDDASPSPHVKRVLEDYARRDQRIRIQFRDTNGHISECTNTALQAARGEYVALLDHDDELRPNALFEMVSALNANRQWRLLYSDEDKIDEQGKRFAPYFKPDWNYELFLAQNCISHLGMYETALVREVGGFRKGFEGAQDWDLALRCVERLNPEQIGHVPRILYHWRAISGSTALGVAHKDYAGSAGARAVEEHLRRTGQHAVVEPTHAGYLRVLRTLESPPRVSLIIPTRDKVDLLRMCVQSILERTDYPDYEILIVDNQSSEDATFEYFRQVEKDVRVRVLHYDAPFNYSLINNYAAERATGTVIGLINNDIEVITPEWLKTMAAQAIRPEIGAVGAMLYYPNDTIQHAGVVLGIGGVAGHAYTGLRAGAEGQCGRALLAQEMSAVTAACLLVRKNVFDEVGGLDPKLVVAFNDVDFCIRILDAGYRNIWTPYAQLYHHESASRGYEDTPEKVARFNGEVARMVERWGETLLVDPCYNPNLTTAGTPFDLAFPPRRSPRGAMVPGRPGQWRSSRDTPSAVHVPNNRQGD